MADKSKSRLSFDEIQNQMGNLKNLDNEFGYTEENISNVDAQVATPKKEGKTIKEQAMSSLKGAASIALLGILAQMLFPWWTIAVVGFWVGFWVADTPAKSFAYGFLSMFLVWSIFAGYQSVNNSGLMSTSISGLLGGQLNSIQLIFATGSIGGFVTGLATMSGALLQQFFKKEV